MYCSRRGAPGGAKSATACITSLRVAGETIDSPGAILSMAKLMLVDFNLTVSAQTAKPPN